MAQARSRDDVPKKYDMYLRAVWPQRSVQENGKKGMIYCMDHTMLKPGFVLDKDERGKVCTQSHVHPVSCAHQPSRPEFVVANEPPLLVKACMVSL